MADAFLYTPHLILDLQVLRMSDPDHHVWRRNERGYERIFGRDGVPRRRRHLRSHLSLVCWTATHYRRRHR